MKTRCRRSTQGKELKKVQVLALQLHLKEHNWAWYQFSRSADSQRRFLLEQDRIQYLRGQKQVPIMHPFRYSVGHKG